MTSPRTHPRRAGVLLAAIMIGALLGACGGGDDSEQASATEWAGAVCGSLSSWLEQLQSGGTGLQSAVQAAPGDLEAAKAEFVGFMQNAVDSTDEMIKQVEAAGVPDVDKGDELSRGLTDGLGEIKQAFADGKSKAEGLSTADPGAFAQGAQELGSDLEEASNKAEEELNDLNEEYDVPTLDKAFEETPACQQLNA